MSKIEEVIAARRVVSNLEDNLKLAQTALKSLEREFKASKLVLHKINPPPRLPCLQCRQMTLSMGVTVLKCSGCNG